MYKVKINYGHMKDATAITNICLKHKVKKLKMTDVCFSGHIVKFEIEDVHTIESIFNYFAAHDIEAFLVSCKEIKNTMRLNNKSLETATKNTEQSNIEMLKNYNSTMLIDELSKRTGFSHKKLNITDSFKVYGACDVLIYRKD